MRAPRISLHELDHLDHGDDQIDVIARFTVNGQLFETLWQDALRPGSYGLAYRVTVSDIMDSEHNIRALAEALGLSASEDEDSEGCCWLLLINKSGLLREINDQVDDYAAELKG